MYHRYSALLKSAFCRSSFARALLWVRATYLPFSVMVGCDKPTVPMLIGGGVLALSLLLTERQPSNKTIVMQGEHGHELEL